MGSNPIWLVSLWKSRLEEKRPVNIQREDIHLPTKVRDLWENQYGRLLDHEILASRMMRHSLPSGNFHKPLIVLHQKADRLKTTVTENEQTWSHGPQPCLTQWNYEPCCVGPPKTNRSWWRILTKRGPLEKGMENHWVFLPWEPHEQYEKAKR